MKGEVALGKIFGIRNIQGNWKYWSERRIANY